MRTFTDVFVFTIMLAKVFLFFPSCRCASLESSHMLSTSSVGFVDVVPSSSFTGGASITNGSAPTLNPGTATGTNLANNRPKLGPKTHPTARTQLRTVIQIGNVAVMKIILRRALFNHL